MIRLAEITDLESVLQITSDTISEIYSHYYAEGVVDFFLEHHSRGNVLSDIENGIVWLLEEDGCMVGTVTIKGNAVNRLFVLPEYQSRGYGSELMNFAEAKIAEKFSCVHIDSSSAAKEMYLKRGYKEKRTCRIPADNGDILIYDEMEKWVNNQQERINYNGKVFMPQSNTENGEVDAETIFHYFQENDLFWAEYSGGDVLKGHMIGTVAENGELDFHYQHLNQEGQVRIGKCHSIPYILENGKIELQEKWQWLNGDLSSGESVLIEK
ncbi:MAG: GNAT family N-acetyltransferase [Lachnospiraceae bacterium]|nr:GNAT family N-acetyltransferase [Lachnospiraceae bacterium]